MELTIDIVHRLCTDETIEMTDHVLKRCTQCGEVSYTGTVVAKLEIIIEKLKESLTEIAVVNYTDKVA